jgi:SAM-dependent methyltransferase
MPNWEDLFRLRQWGQWPDSALIRFYKGQFQKVWSSRLPPAVLEIGAGSGANLWFLAREGAAVSAIDISPTAIKLAHEKLDSEVTGWCWDSNPTDRIVACSATVLPFLDDSFDVVVDVECLAHMDLDAARLAVAECFRVARPGAWLFCRMLDDTNELQGNTLGNAGLIVVDEGMLSGMPPLRLTSAADLVDLLTPWALHSIDSEVRTMNNGLYRLSEHIVVARKPL